MLLTGSQLLDSCWSEPRSVLQLCSGHLMVLVLRGLVDLAPLCVCSCVCTLPDMGGYEEPLRAGYYAQAGAGEHQRSREGPGLD